MRRALTFVTGNAGKLQEVRTILSNYEIKHVDADLFEYQGDPMEIVTRKLLDASEKYDGPVLIEDTSLCFDALGGLPGPYIKWFLEKLGPDGLPKLLAGFEDKKAYAMCIFAYTENKGKGIKVFQGIVSGTIVEPRGERNFGWDPIFQPEGFDKTFAEMDSSTKNTISHRSKALSLLKEHLETE